MPKSEGYVSPEYLKIIASYARDFKNKTIDEMNLKEGDSVLEIGCGPAIDTHEIASRVGEAGSVIGLDIDSEMIAISEKETAKAGFSDIVSYREGSADALPFEDNSFDAVRAERLFQVLPNSVDPSVVFTEARRVLKEEGIFSALDTDWSTASIDFPKRQVERKLMNYFTDTLRPNGYAGGQLYRLFRETGFRDISLTSTVLTYRSLVETPFGESFINTAVSNAVITEEEGIEWLSVLKKRSDDGTFYGNSNFVTVLGNK